MTSIHPLKRFLYITLKGNTPASFAFHLGAFYRLVRDGLLTQIKEIHVERGCSVLLILYALQHWKEWLNPELQVQCNEDSDACHRQVVVPLQTLFFQPLHRWVDVLCATDRWSIETLEHCIQQSIDSLPHVYIFSTTEDIVLDSTLSFKLIASQCLSSIESISTILNSIDKVHELCNQRIEYVKRIRVPPRQDSFRYQHWIFWAGADLNDLQTTLIYVNEKCPRIHGLKQWLIYPDLNMIESLPVKVFDLEAYDTTDTRLSLDVYVSLVTHGKQRTAEKTEALRRVGLLGQTGQHLSWTVGMTTDVPLPLIRSIIYTPPPVPPPLIEELTICQALLKWWKRKKTISSSSAQLIPAPPPVLPPYPYPITMPWSNSTLGTLPSCTTTSETTLEQSSRSLRLPLQSSSHDQRSGDHVHPGGNFIVGKCEDS